MVNLAGIGQAFSAGLQSYREGQMITQNLKDKYDEHEVRGLQASGMKKAAADRQNAIQGMVQTMGDAQHPQFQVAGSTFQNEADAQKFAADHVGSVSDFFNKTYAPQITDLLNQQGHVDMAQKWQTYVDQAQTQSALNFFGKANAARMMGNKNEMIANLMGAVDATSGMHGYKMGGATEIKNANGAVTGYMLNMTTPDGQQVQQPIDGDTHSIFQMAAGIALPGKQQFDTWQANQKGQQEFQQKLGLKNLEIQKDLTVAREGNQTKLATEQMGDQTSMRNTDANNVGGMQRSQLASQTSMRNTDKTQEGALTRTNMQTAAAANRVQQDIDTRTDALNSVPGLSADDKRGATVSIITGNHGTAPTPLREKIYTDAAKNNLEFDSMTPQEKADYVTKQEQSFRQATAPQPAAPQGLSPSQPAAATPQQAQPAQQTSPQGMAFTAPAAPATPPQQTQQTQQQPIPMFDPRTAR